MCACVCDIVYVCVSSCGRAVAVESGALHAAGRRLCTIRDHAERDGHAFINAWTQLPATPLVGSLVTLVAGCDKSFETCRARFANQLNFRGFPHMPGNDVVLGYVSAGQAGMDGGSLFR